MDRKRARQYLEGQLQRLVGLKAGFQVDMKKIQSLKECLWRVRLPTLEIVDKWIKEHDIRHVGEGPGGMHDDDLAVYIYFLGREGAVLGKDYVVFDEMDGAHVGISYDETSPRVERALRNVDIYEENESIANLAYVSLCMSKEEFTIEELEFALQEAIRKRNEMREKRAKLGPEIARMLKEHAHEIRRYEMEKARVLDRRKWLEKKGIDT